MSRTINVWAPRQHCDILLLLLMLRPVILLPLLLLLLLLLHVLLLPLLLLLALLLAPALAFMSHVESAKLALAATKLAAA